MQQNSMLDMLQYGNQNTGPVLGLIPDKSCCRVRTSILESHLTQPKAPGYEYVNLRLEIIAGRYAGRKIRLPLALGGAQNAQQLGFEKHSWHVIKHILEASRGTRPTKDYYDGRERRMLKGLSDLEGLEFYALIGIKKNRRKNPNEESTQSNKFVDVIPVDSNEYILLEKYGELIGGEPLPEDAETLIAEVRHEVENPEPVCDTPAWL